MKGLIFFTLLILISGCGVMADEPDVEGSVVIHMDQPEMFVLFVEDSYSGADYEWPGHGHVESQEDYEVEAYLVHVTDETVIKVEENGEKVELFSDDTDTLARMNTFRSAIPLQVKASFTEDFTPIEKTEQKSRFSYEWSLLPVYEAEELILTRPDKEDVIDSLDLGRGSRNMEWLIVMEFSDEPFEWNWHDPAYDEIHHYSNSNAQAVFRRMSHHEDKTLYEDVVASFPWFMIINGEQEVVHESASLDEVYTFFDQYFDEE
ncbi:hypothetical protein [Alteribacter keqinensis]|uniref:Uncharacterized protein n=1 Tax=Alteribacter keqinensis TaxID=2483800 RepID=A0A3M7TPT7_9BACI|nr:hypothetical protein [Alteribacter keqinensis]RNA67166.1 hypothetical protein EBO34_18465 [Alteribacter keqinensis]